MRLCRNCNSRLIVRQTKKNLQQLKKQYYYTAYYFCPSCKRLYHSDEFKVINVLSPSPLFSSKIDNPAVKNGDTSLLQEETTDKKFDVEIWTDGACVYNGAKNAKAAWAFVSGEFEQAGLVTGKQTNNRGEAFAIYQALLWAAERGYKRIRLYTDSQITLHGVLKNPDKVRENRDIFLRIHQVSVKNKLEIDYQKVLGHAGDKNNERADKLANMLASSSGV